MRLKSLTAVSRLTESVFVVVWLGCCSHLLLQSVLKKRLEVLWLQGNSPEPLCCLQLLQSPLINFSNEKED
jgi:hypothetical protein